MPNQPQLNEARYYHASCTLNRRSYVIGGWNKIKNLDTVESTNGSVWILLWIRQSLICGPCVACPLNETQIIVFSEPDYFRAHLIVIDTNKKTTKEAIPGLWINHKQEYGQAQMIEHGKVVMITRDREKRTHIWHYDHKIA